MYTPKHFEITDRDEILAFIKANAFGQLITQHEGRLISSHIPFMLSDDGLSLLCHLAKANTQWQSIAKQEILVTFLGSHDYISPSVYETSGVPTWNYQAIHIYGKAKLITDTDALKQLVNKLTAIYESSRPAPWKVEYKESLLNAIIGIEIDIKEIQAKYKLSQNRSVADREKIVVDLESRHSTSLSAAMNLELQE